METSDTGHKVFSTLHTGSAIESIDRIVAVYPDGRAYAWHQINRCGEVVFDGNSAPEGCPTPPEGLN